MDNSTDSILIRVFLMCITCGGWFIYVPMFHDYFFYVTITCVTVACTEPTYGILNAIEVLVYACAANQAGACGCGVHCFGKLLPSLQSVGRKCRSLVLGEIDEVDEFLVKLVAAINQHQFSAGGGKNRPNLISKMFDKCFKCLSSRLS